MLRSAAAIAALFCVAATARAADPPLPETIVSVIYVRPGSMADKLGIRRGDVLLLAGGAAIRRGRKRCRSLEDATDAVEKMRRPSRRGPGEGEVPLEILRAGEVVTCGVPESALGDDWELRVRVWDNFLPRLGAGGDAEPRWGADIERAVRCAAAMDWPRALEAARKAFDEGLRDPDAYALAATCSCRMVDFERAVEFFQKALELDPAHVEARAGLGAALLFAGRPDEAAASFARLKPDDEIDTYVSWCRDAARGQAGLVEAAAADRRRRGLGIMPDLLAEGADLRQVQVEDLKTGQRLGPAKRRGWRRTKSSERTLSDFVMTIEVAEAEACHLDAHPAYFYSAHPATVYVSLRTDGGDRLRCGLSAAGDAALQPGTGLWHIIPNLTCVRPLGESNRLRLVRQGHRFTVFTNGVLTATFLATDEPLRYAFHAMNLEITFRNVSLQIPRPRATHAPARGGEVEEVF